MPRLAAIQRLRALAVLLVLVGHVLAEAGHYLRLDLPGAAIPWTRGVDIFFVVSGVVITLSARHATGAGDFLRRRALRIVPLYWLFTSLMVLALFLPGATKETALEPGQIVSSYLFLPWERHDGRIAPVLSPGWTLNYEMTFYALFAAAMALRVPLAGTAAALVALVGAGVILRPEAPALVFWTNPLMLEFLFGIAIAQAWLHLWPRHHPWLGWSIAALGLLLLTLGHQTALPRVIAAGLPAALIVAGPVLLDRAQAAPGPLTRLGDASYALYLSHRFVLRALTLIVMPLVPGSAAPPVAALLYTAIAGMAVLWIGLVVHDRVERPLLGLARRRRTAPA